MSSRTTIIVPQLPPSVCGIGDYTMKLVQSWPEQRDFSFLVARGLEASRQALARYQMEGMALNAQGLAEDLERMNSSEVLLQYSGFGFDPKGCPLWLPEALAVWKRKQPGRKVAVMFHELWSARPWWDPRVIRSWLHRYSIRKLVNLSDAVFTNTEGYAGWLRDFRSSTPVTVIPVGSNVTVYGESSAGREPGLMVVFGKQGTRMLALRPMKEALGRLSQAGRLSRLLIVGGSTDGARAELDFMRDVLPEDQLAATGFLDDRDLSSLLMRAEFGVSAQDWLSVEKSTTFMAYAAHGLNILSPYAGTDQQPPFAWLTGVEELLRGDAALEQILQARSAALRDWYTSVASWPAIATRMSRVMSNVSKEPVDEVRR